MSLEFQTVDVKFDKGLETKAQQKLVVAGKWLTLQNVTLSTDYTPRKRDGIAALMAANGNGLATYGKELLVVNGGAVKSISTGAATAKTVSGEIGFVGVTKREIRRSTGMQDTPDCASNGVQTCYVWRELSAAGIQTGMTCSLNDEVTGTQLVSSFTLITSATASCPRVVYASGAFFIFYRDATHLYGRVILTATPTVVGGQTALITDANLGVGNFDACAFGAAFTVATAMVVYPWNDGIDTVKTIQVNQTPGIAAGPTKVFSLAEVPAPTGLCCVATGANCTIFSLMAGANPLSGGVINSSWTLITGWSNFASTTAPAGTCHVAAVVLASGNVTVFYDQQGAYNTTSFGKISTLTTTTPAFAVQSSGTVVASSSFTGFLGLPAAPQGPWIAGKPFVKATSTFLPVCMLSNYSGSAQYGPNGAQATSNTQNGIFLMDCTAITGAVVGTVVARALYGSLGMAAINNQAPVVSTPCSTPSTASGVFELACPEATLPTVVSGINISSSGLVSLSFTPNTTAAPIRAQLGESTYWAGGNLATYDGSGVVEHGFPMYPEGVSLAIAAGGNVTAGVHQLVFIYEWVDNAGQRHQSGNSLQGAVTVVGGTQTITALVPSLFLSQKTGVTIVAYMTQAAGTTFNRVATVAAPGGTPNDTTQAYVAITITSADAIFSGNELLYTQPDLGGSTLANISPGPCTVLGVHQKRLWCDVADQPGAYVFSQEYVNNLGLQFNSALGGTVGLDAGAFAGFRSMDEKQIILCSRKLFVVHGNGPNSSGVYSAYSAPQEIPFGMGCSEPRSILLTESGIIFKTLNGWYMLGRDLIVRYIGAGVAAFDANAVSSAVLLPDSGECRFSSNTTSTTLIYDTRTGEWATTVYAGAISPYLVTDAVWWTTGGYYVHSSLTDGLNKDTPGVYVDSPGVQGPAAISMKLQTAFLHVASLEAFQRVRWLYLTGTTQNTPLGTLNIAVDFDDAIGGAAPGSYNFNVTLSSLGIVAGMPMDLRHKLRRQKCKSVSFTFTETPVAGGASAQLTGLQALALQVGTKRGVNKLKGTQGVG